MTRAQANIILFACMVAEISIVWNFVVNISVIIDMPKGSNFKIPFTFVFIIVMEILMLLAILAIIIFIIFYLAKSKNSRKLAATFYMVLSMMVIAFGILMWEFVVKMQSVHDTISSGNTYSFETSYIFQMLIEGISIALLMVAIIYNIILILNQHRSKSKM